MIANSIKKEIINDWASSFMDLFPYAQNKLYKVIGSFVVGIELLSLPRTEDYRPVFVFYPLWRSDMKQCLDEPLFMQEIYNKKGLQFNIPYLKHKASLVEAIECTKKQAPILSNNTASLKQLLEVIDRQFAQTLIKSSPVGQAKLFEGKLFAALYLNDVNVVKEILTELNRTSKNWAPSLFEWKYGKLDDWLQKLQISVSDRDSFLKQVNTNLLDKKITKLQTSKLTV